MITDHGRILPPPLWSVYLLVNSQTGRTYIGSTTDPARRLRQHNKEIKGGARSTVSGAPYWRLLLYVEGFLDRSSACRWEKLVKSRATGQMKRYKALAELVDGCCPTLPGRKQYPVPPGLTGNIGDEALHDWVLSGKGET